MVKYTSARTDMEGRCRGENCKRQLHFLHFFFSPFLISPPGSLVSALIRQFLVRFPQKLILGGGCSGVVINQHQLIGAQSKSETSTKLHLEMLAG